MLNLEKLIEYGILGFYKSCEAIQIFLIDRRENTNKYINFYTIFAFEEKEYKSKNKEKLTEKLIPIDNNFSLGIEKHYFSINETVDIFNKLKTGEFSEDNIILKGCSFKLLKKQYIPSEISRLNNILKNNFFTGSYIFEFFEEDKNVFNYFEDKPTKLKKIIEKTNKIIPIDFTLNKDRIGNYIFQLPIKIVKIKSRANKDFDGFYIDFEWNKKLEDIPNCIITHYAKIDGNFLSNNITEYNKEKRQLIKTGTLDKSGNYSIWRLNPNILLFNEDTNYFRKMYVEAVTSAGEREFKNKLGEQTVELRTSSDYNKDYEKYLQIIENTNSTNLEKELEQNCSFKLYGKNKDSKDSMNCLIKLIQDHGYNGIDLLDPYLTYEEILSTIYYSNVANVPLRAITSKNAINNNENTNNIDEFIRFNRNKLKKLSNNLNLNFEFRIETGKNSFHDRFLIFPENSKKLEKARVYSLGTSVNGFGKRYHILQEISTPKKIVDLFEELWKKSEGSDYRIWPPENL